MLSRPVPFTTDKAYGGFAEVDGQMTLHAEELCLEFQVKDAVFGAIKSGVKELTIPLDEIDDLKFEKKLFSRRLTLRTNSLATLDGLPGAEGATLVVKIAKKDTEAAKQMASHVLLVVSEARLRQLEDESQSS